jgi:hypothetical protein
MIYWKRVPSGSLLIELGKTIEKEVFSRRVERVYRRMGWFGPRKASNPFRAIGMAGTMDDTRRV